MNNLISLFWDKSIKVKIFGVFFGFLIWLTRNATEIIAPYASIATGIALMTPVPPIEPLVKKGEKFEGSNLPLVKPIMENTSNSAINPRVITRLTLPATVMLSRHNILTTTAHITAIKTW